MRPCILKSHQMRPLRMHIAMRCVRVCTPNLVIARLICSLTLDSRILSICATCTVLKPSAHRRRILRCMIDNVGIAAIGCSNKSACACSQVGNRLLTGHPSAARRTALSNSSLGESLYINPCTPDRGACSTARDVANAVMSRIPIRDVTRRMAHATSRPFITGISKSQISTSGSRPSSNNAIQQSTAPSPVCQQ